MSADLGDGLTCVVHKGVRVALAAKDREPTIEEVRAFVWAVTFFGFLLGQAAPDHFIRGVWQGVEWAKFDTVALDDPALVEALRSANEFRPRDAEPAAERRKMLTLEQEFWQ